jgi:hypothetical protein
MAIQPRFRAIGTFPNRREAEEALDRLRASGFSMDKVSVLAKDADRSERIGGAEVKDRGDNESQEGAGIGAVTGTVLGGIGGLLVGLEALIIPGVGPFLAAGTIATTLAGAGIGAAAGGIIGALTGLGIPEEDARGYSEQVDRGDYLVMVEGSLDDIDRAGSSLGNQGIRGWNVYDIESGGRYHADVASRPIDRTASPINRDIKRSPTDRTTGDRPDVEIIDRRDEAR